MNRILVYIFFIGCVDTFYGQAFIDPVLLKSDKEKLNVIIQLNSHADISQAKYIRGKEAKTAYVYEALYLHAQQSQKDLVIFLTSNNIRHRAFYIVNMISAEITKDQLDVLSRQKDVASIIEDGKFKGAEIVRDDEGTNDRTVEWNLTKIKADSVWLQYTNGSGVIIGGQDTGYDWDHPAIINQYKGWNGSVANHNFNWHDAIHTSSGNPCGNNAPAPCDDNNHGTHTMGTMVGDDGVDNQIGVAPGAKWIGCRNMDKGNGTLSTYVECFEWFLAPYPVGGNPSQGDPNQAPHVINNSWGCPPSEGCNTTNFGIMEAALNTLRLAGTVVVVSAGNSGSLGCGSVSDPAAIFEGSFSVGSTTSADNISGFSSRGPVTIDGSGRLKPNISAPGSSVRSCIPGTGYAVYSGTSMAGPHVAGLVALIIAANPTLAGEVDAIEKIIEETAVPKTTTQNCGSITGTEIPNNTFGFGRIDA